ncbi:Ger(x)C family spore germination protein [Metabacillus sp. RGM 3146]|uniref:Ger(x)C family spore germination protein n=1 Tax=Metabacillus sp. RGM 3146 TaxID=3401092 RepID=UPI003B99A987
MLQKILKLSLAGSILLLSGCWDQNLLKDVRLIRVAAYDLDKGGRLKNSVLVRRAKGTGGSNSTEEELQVYQGVGSTPRGVTDDLDRKIDKRYESSKLRVLLIGEELAKTDIYQLIDTFYRDPKSAINAKILVVEGEAGTLIKTAAEQEIKISDYIADMIESAQRATFTRDINIQSICSEMLDPGQDFTLPMIKTDEDMAPSIHGLALFNTYSMSGKLYGEEAILYQLMDNVLAKQARLTEKVFDNQPYEYQNYVSIDAAGLKRKIKITAPDENSISVRIMVDINAKVIEYPHNQLEEPGAIQKLNKKLSKQLTAEAEKIVTKLQEANCDGLAIGRNLIAHHPEIWKKTKWKEVYPKIKITPIVNVSISQKGIVN